MRRPSFQFYPADWRKDPSLSTCSLAARGFWIEIVCIMHESEQYGILSINGKPMSVQQIARSVGETPTMVSKLIQEIEDAGVCSRTENGSIFSRRMIKDEHIRNVRATAGKLGGNPNLLVPLLGDKVKQIDKQIPTPSSSSSSSSTVNLKPPGKPPPPKIRKGTKITFPAWIAEIKASGKKPISDYAPVWDYAEKVGIPAEWIHIAWIKFAERYGKDPNHATKKYIDWRRVFLNAIEGNWLKLWYAKDGKFELSTVGAQADLSTLEAA